MEVKVVYNGSAKTDTFQNIHNVVSTDLLLQFLSFITPHGMAINRSSSQSLSESTTIPSSILAIGHQNLQLLPAEAVQHHCKCKIIHVHCVIKKGICAFI